MIAQTYSCVLHRTVVDNVPSRVRFGSFVRRIRSYRPMRHTTHESTVDRQRRRLNFHGFSLPIVPEILDEIVVTAQKRDPGLWLFDPSARLLFRRGQQDARPEPGVDSIRHHSPYKLSFPSAMILLSK